MWRGGWVLLWTVIGCTPPPSLPPPPPRPEPPATPAPAAPSPPPVQASAAPPPGAPAARRSREGECDLGKALDAFVMGQATERCGDLGWRDLPPRPQGDAYERARACVVAALRAHRAFTVSWGGPGIDSIMRQGLAGRDGGYGYEVRHFSYDSCPAGCGGAEPVWSSIVCEPLVDLRVTCPAEEKKRKPDRELLFICDKLRDPGEKRKNQLELLCKPKGEKGELRTCGWETFLERERGGR